MEKKIEFLPVTYMMRHSILTQENQKWPTWNGKTVHRSQVLTASEATNCVRMLAFNKNEERRKLKEAKGVPAKEYWAAQDEGARVEALHNLKDGPQGIFARGHNVEHWLVDQLKAYADQSPTVSVFHTAEDQVSFNVLKHRLSSTPDGFMVDEAVYKMHGLEVKSSNRWMMSRPSIPHNAQVLINMGIVRHLAETVGHYELYKMMGWDQHFEFEGDKLPAFDSAQIIYINPANYLETKEHTIEWDNGVAYDAARIKAKRLFPVDPDTGKRKLAKPADLPAAGLTVPGGCYFCEHKRACALIEKGEGRNFRSLEEVDLDEGEEALPKIDVQAPVQDQEAQTLQRFFKAKNLESAAKKESEALKSDVKMLFDKHGVEEGESALLELTYPEPYGAFKVRRTVSKRKGGIDDKELAQALKQLDKTVDDFRKEDTTVESISVTSAN